MGFHGDPRLQETTVGNDGAKAGGCGASDIGAGVLGYASRNSSAAIVAFGGLRASAMSYPYAGEFFGNVVVNGDIFLPGADCAEQFDFADAEQIEAGDVVVIDPAGELRQSQVAYDRKVAGIVSGAGELRPGIVLGQQQSQRNRLPVALIGKVYCKVDAQYGAIEVGDLLTTSPTAGHAMKADDPVKAFGAVQGKAVSGLMSGKAWFNPGRFAVRQDKESYAEASHLSGRSKTHRPSFCRSGLFAHWKYDQSQRNGDSSAGWDRLF
jgi:hypothetical protein